MCARGYLDDYAGVGGKWQRSDPAYGRVGSIFSDPGSAVGPALPTDVMDPPDDSTVPTEQDPYSEEVYYDESSLDGAYSGSISDFAEHEADGVIILDEEY